MKNRTGRRAAKKFTQLQAGFDVTKTPDFQLRQDLVNANAALKVAEPEEKARSRDEAQRLSLPTPRK